MTGFIKRHREIRERKICFPPRDHLPFIAIDYRDVTRVGNIDENSASVFLQLKSFRMGVEFYGPYLFPVRRVNNGDASTTKPDIDLFLHFIVPDIVGVIFKIQFSNSLE